MKAITVTTVAALAAVSLLGACKPAAPAVDKAKIAEAIKAVEVQWVADIKTRDPAKFASYYTSDTTMIMPGGPPAHGAAAVQAGMTESFKDPNFGLEFAADAADVSDAGDMAYTQGHFTEYQTDPTTHAKVSQSGSYVTVWKKQADGSWKAAQDIVTSGGPPPAAPKS